jgi:hypothetical protein
VEACAVASVLAIETSPEIVMHSPTTLPLVLLNAEVSRPYTSRTSGYCRRSTCDFPGRREVRSTSRDELVLLPVCPAFFLGLGHEI